MERFLLVAQCYCPLRFLNCKDSLFVKGTSDGNDHLWCRASGLHVFERLGLELSAAQMDYESFNGIHNFTITHAGTRFRIQFAEQTLLTRSMEQLEETICKIAERVLCNGTLRALQNTHRHDA